MQKMATCLWYDNQAEEAAKFYASIFKDSKILGTAYYGESASKAAGRPKGSVMTVRFELNGQEFVALNGGPIFKHSPAFSIMVYCKTQKEIDEYWKKLTQGGGQESQCGWLTDKFGISWQIVPAALAELMSGKDPARYERVMSALLQMRKLDIQTLKEAAEGKEKAVSAR